MPAASLYKSQAEKCCTSPETLYDEILAQWVCSICGHVDDSPGDDLGHSVRSIYTYDRRQRFRAVVNQIQGKISTPVPEEIMDMVRAEIDARQISHSDVTWRHIRSFLSRANATKYYRHVTAILAQINPASVKRFTPDQERTLYYMFDVIQEPFVKFCPPDRSNILGYPYILHKFVRILGLDRDILEGIPMLKSRTKLAAHDRTWRQIIEYIQAGAPDGIPWTFHDSS